jgi:hypothetical protein
MTLEKYLQRHMPAVLLLLFTARTPAGAVSNSGTAGYSFLNIPVGARASAMGQAFTSVPNDIQGITYNPACLATMVASQATFQQLNYVEDVTQQELAFGHAGREQEFSWGAVANYLRVGGIDRTAATLSPSGDGFTEQGEFSTYDLMTEVSLAGQLMEGLSIGTSLKFLRESLADASSDAGALDLGVFYQGNEERTWNVGAALQNAGFAGKFADAAVKLPLTFRVGLSGQPFAQWLLAADYVQRVDTNGAFDVGAEVTPMKYLSLRIGYSYPLIRPDLGGLAEFSAGVGLRVGSTSLDYAFVPLGDLGLTHHVSLNFRFKSH